MSIPDIKLDNGGDEALADYVVLYERDGKLFMRLNTYESMAQMSPVEARNVGRALTQWAMEKGA